MPKPPKKSNWEIWNRVKENIFEDDDNKWYDEGVVRINQAIRELVNIGFTNTQLH